jgi:hypothetical protein
LGLGEQVRMHLVFLSEYRKLLKDKGVAVCGAVGHHNKNP